MTWHRLALILVLGSSLHACTQAGIFSRKPKPSPQRAQELIGIIKSDARESKREAAVDELGSYDAQTYPEIVPVLLEALRDSSADVRLQAVQALGKVRPVSQEVGMALEQTMNSDSSRKVRLQARTTLWQYHLAGYRSGKQEGPQLPLASESAAGPQLSTQPAPVLPALPQSPATTTQEPPLAEPPMLTRPMPAPRTTPTGRLTPVPAAVPQPTPRPLPAAQPPLAPTPAPVLQMPPPRGEQGPALNPPQ